MELNEQNKKGCTLKQ